VTGGFGGRLALRLRRSPWREMSGSAGEFSLRSRLDDKPTLQGLQPYDSPSHGRALGVWRARPAIPAYPADALPLELAALPAVKPGSRALTGAA
jgi:hypothetical protein